MISNDFKLHDLGYGAHRTMMNYGYTTLFFLELHPQVAKIAMWNIGNGPWGYVFFFGKVVIHSKISNSFEIVH